MISTVITMVKDTAHIQDAMKEMTDMMLMIIAQKDEGATSNK